MWVRGLKLDMGLGKTVSTLVAPYVGAWIETQIFSGALWPGSVAPYVGAWIETTEYGATYAWNLSHPMWVRGLKHRCPQRQV